MNAHVTGILDFGAQSAVFGRVRRDGCEGCEGRIEELLVESGERHADGPAQADWRGEACIRLAARTRYRGPVTLIVPTHLLLAKHLDLPPVNGARRDKALHFAARQAIPYPLAEVVWGAMDADEGRRGSSVLLLGAKREAVEQLCGAAEGAGFRVESALPAPLAFLKAHRVAGGRDEGPELLLTLGEHAHELALARAEAIRLRLFAACGTGRNEVATRLADEIERTLRHFGAEGKGWDRRPKYGWLAGSAATPGLATELSGLLGFQVEQRMIAPAGPVPGDEAPEVFRWRMLGASTIVFNREGRGTELLPASRQHRLRWRHRAPWLAATAALTLAAMLPPIAHHRAAAATALDEVARLEVELAPLRMRAAQDFAHRQRREALRHQIAVLAHIRQGKHQWLGLLADLQQRLAMVEDAWLDRLEVVTFDEGGSADEPTVRLAVSGRLLDRASPGEQASPAAFAAVRELLNGIAAAPWVAAVERERLERPQPGVLRFDFTIVLKMERTI